MGTSGFGKALASDTFIGLTACAVIFGLSALLVLPDGGYLYAPEADPDIDVTGCEIDNSEPHRATAEVTYEFTHQGDTEGSYWLDITVSDSEGSPVGSARDWVIDVKPGQRATGHVRLYLDVADGSRCDVKPVEE